MMMRLLALLSSTLIPVMGAETYMTEVGEETIDCGGHYINKKKAKCYCFFDKIQKCGVGNKTDALKKKAESFLDKHNLTDTADGDGVKNLIGSLRSYEAMQSVFASAETHEAKTELSKEEKRLKEIVMWIYDIQDIAKQALYEVQDLGRKYRAVAKKMKVRKAQKAEKKKKKPKAENAKLEKKIAAALPTLENIEKSNCNDYYSDEIDGGKCYCIFDQKKICNVGKSDELKETFEDFIMGLEGEDTETVEAAEKLGARVDGVLYSSQMKDVINKNRDETKYLLFDQSILLDEIYTGLKDLGKKATIAASTALEAYMENEHVHEYYDYVGR